MLRAGIRELGLHKVLSETAGRGDDRQTFLLREADLAMYQAKRTGTEGSIVVLDALPTARGAATSTAPLIVAPRTSPEVSCTSPES
jgi:GGDEF domain-containing protein